jgi:hypothetical protein
VLAASYIRAARSEAYGNACERARKHVRSEGEVGREGFIAVRQSAVHCRRRRRAVGAVLVFFFDGNARSVMGGHEAASRGRCGFQVCD